ncbi:DinB family protein [Chryseolinea sp. H1M3-3]|uniref:DinB family protein n=1 Tax=Chryseolinea sp. H1M3-3 TaxID=3034144 RepID=UPI0023EE0412|nr:DinB family protein [Chryseolinea sp. H1M3-3]
MAEAMPETRYDFKPSPDVWNFKELMNHIVYGISWWENNYLKKIETPWNPPPILGKRQEILDAMHKAYDALAQTIAKGKSNDGVLKGFHATLDHVTHHRGQAIVYLRCNGITPPEYTF